MHRFNLLSFLATFFIFLILNTGFGATEVSKVSWVEIGFQAGELRILNQTSSKDILLTLVGPLQAFSQVGGHFRHGKYWYCMVEEMGERSCQLYLKDNGLGEMSSWEDDPDFGKSNLTEFLSSRPIRTKARMKFTTKNLILNFSGEIAQYYFNRMFMLPEKSNPSASVIKGKHISCKKSLDGDFSCEISIPRDDYQSPNSLPFHFKG